ncbi:hypothetical protein MMC07_001023 [Pseudocyphellaria aurata]|nr:hypothetical protein [Pseudocyphellaria aurata]
MSEQTPLRGACSCGRNQYLIGTSFSPEETPQVLLEEKADQGKLVIESRVLSLRIPLSHLRSTTYAFYPDETHNAIRRAFTPQNAPHTKRHFCGFCGTQLTYWSEETREEAEWVCVSIGTLKSESLEKLEEAGLLAGAEENEKAETSDWNDGKKGTMKRKLKIGTPWFEEMIQGSELGRMKRRRGGQSSLDGRRTVEWEIVEFTTDDEKDSIIGTGKRKIDITDDDVPMRGGA